MGGKSQVSTAGTVLFQRKEALAAVGAVLFVASDSMIAINRFQGHFRLAELLILVTYFTAQWLIALSVP